jgi:hypothetical protein
VPGINLKRLARNVANGTRMPGSPRLTAEGDGFGLSVPGRAIWLLSRGEDVFQ